MRLKCITYLMTLAPLSMNRYEATWFDHGEWRQIHLELIAESEEQVRRHIDKDYPLWYRLKLRYGRQGPDEDSLKIKKVETVELPYVLREY